jgi:hypothetical protein
MPNALSDVVFKTPCMTVANLSSAARLALQQARAAHQWDGVTVTQRSPVTGHNGRRLFLICEFGRAMVVCRKKSSFLLGKVGAVGSWKSRPEVGLWSKKKGRWWPEECSFFPLELGTQPNRNIIMK